MKTKTGSFWRTAQKEPVFYAVFIPVMPENPSFRRLDETAAEDEPAAVEYRTLTRCRGTNGFGEGDQKGAVRLTGDLAGYRLGGAAHLDPVIAVCQRLAVGGGNIADHHAGRILAAAFGQLYIAVRQDGLDKEGAPCGNAQPLALANGVVVHAGMLAQVFAVRTDEMSGFGGEAIWRADESRHTRRRG